MMYCPKCRDEFREGVMLCERCNEKLVDDLPELESEEVAKSSRASSSSGFFCTEKWLIYGGMIYIILGILYVVIDQYKMIYHPNPDSISGYGSGWIFMQLVNFCYALAGSVMWGVLFCGIGKIIEILREGFNREEV